MVIIDAWMQHPSAEFLADPMFDSLRRWARGQLAGDEIPAEATVAAMDAAGVRTGMLCAWWGPRGPLISNDAVAAIIAEVRRRQPSADHQPRELRHGLDGDATLDDVRAAASEELQRAIEQLTAAHEVADLEYQVAQSNLEASQVRMDAGTATLHDVEDARSQANERYNTLQDASFELQKARITLLRATDELAAWAGVGK